MRYFILRVATNEEAYYMGMLRKLLHKSAQMLGKEIGDVIFMSFASIDKALGNSYERIPNPKIPGHLCIALDIPEENELNLSKDKSKDYTRTACESILHQLKTFFQGIYDYEEIVESHWKELEEFALKYKEPYVHLSFDLEKDEIYHDFIEEWEREVGASELVKMYKKTDYDYQDKKKKETQQEIEKILESINKKVYDFESLANYKEQLENLARKMQDPVPPYKKMRISVPQVAVIIAFEELGDPDSAHPRDILEKITGWVLRKTKRALRKKWRLLGIPEPEPGAA